MDHLKFIIECDQDVADELAASLVDATGAEVSSATKRNLDGAAETVIQLVEVAFSLSGTVIPLVLTWVGRDKVRKIRVGDIEIENPSREQAEALWQQYLADKHGDA